MCRRRKTKILNALFLYNGSKKNAFFFNYRGSNYLIPPFQNQPIFAALFKVKLFIGSEIVAPLPFAVRNQTTSSPYSSQDY